MTTVGEVAAQLADERDAARHWARLWKHKAKRYRKYAVLCDNWARRYVVLKHEARQQ